MSSEKEKSDDKPQASRPPVPPPPGKKPVAGLPKGPVPPRNPVQLPRAGAPQTPGGPPPAMPGLPGMPGAPKPFAPSMPPMGGMPPKAPGAMPPAGPPMAMPPAAAKFNAQMSQAEEAQSGLQDKVAELEKKLMEEREKVLLGQLRSKEEEAVSAKVETSIREIQDKLRRERKEQELEEQRRKAEGKVLQMERRLAEEREAWVSTLKGQLTQRDQITQEMESHFATRLKDLEYRWAQEKSVLESSVRERDAEIVRIRQEVALKSEHDKAFWEDRVKSIANDREKIERDMERTGLKFQQEKDQLVFERQSLRDAVSKLESAVKFVEEQGRVEKATVKRELESALDIARQQANLEKENLNRKIAELTHQFEQAAKDAQAARDAMRREVDQRDSAQQLHLRDIDDARRRMSSLQAELDDARKMVADLERGSLSRRQDVDKVKDEYESRMKTLQTRLDWYDANIKREYEMARDNVRKELDTMQGQLKEAQGIAEANVSAKENLARTEEERNALHVELDNLKNEWKQVQREMISQTNEVEERLKAEQRKAEEILENKLAVEQELRQRISQVQAMQDALDHKQDDIDRFQKAIQLERDKTQSFQEQMEEYKHAMSTQGMDSLLKLKTDLADKDVEIDQLKQKLASLKAGADSQDEKENIYKDKERVLRQMVTDKEETVAEFKNRVHTLERQLGELNAERDSVDAEAKKKIERVLQLKQRELDDRLAEQKTQFEQSMRQEIDAVRAEAARATTGAPADSAPVDVEGIERQMRQRIEGEVLDQLREKETAMEQKVKELTEETKKEADKWRWENDNLKEELRRSREARMQIEREAQELIQQAELHYKGEFEKRMAELQEEAKNGRGFFGAIGKILDTPIIDTNKKKDL